MIKGELMTTTTHADEKNNEKVPGIELDVEELEEVIAPGKRYTMKLTVTDTVAATAMRSKPTSLFRGLALALAFAWAGSSAFSQNRFLVARFDTSGRLDTDFANTGVVVAEFRSTSGDSHAEANAIAIDRQDRIVLAGFATLNAHKQFALTRYNWDGRRDTGFGGTDSKVATNFPSGQDEWIKGIALDGNNKILAAGAVQIGFELPLGAINNFAVARYLEDG